MLPIPHILLFVPVGIFAALAAISALTQFITRFATPIPAEVPRQTARIFYFTPRKTPLASGPKQTGQPVRHQRYRAFDGG